MRYTLGLKITFRSDIEASAGWNTDRKNECLLSKGLSFISNRQRRKEGTFCASELAGIEPTPPAPEEQGMRAFVCFQVRGVCRPCGPIEPWLS